MVPDLRRAIRPSPARLRSDRAGVKPKDSVHVALPLSPGTVQKAAAAKLLAIPAAQFDKTYDKIQIAGHVESIAHTKAEIAVGKNEGVIEFAKYYLPVAEKHLRMARADLAAL